MSPQPTPTRDVLKLAAQQLYTACHDRTKSMAQLSSVAGDLIQLIDRLPTLDAPVAPPVKGQRNFWIHQPYGIAYVLKPESVVRDLPPETLIMNEDLTGNWERVDVVFAAQALTDQMSSYQEVMKPAMPTDPMVVAQIEEARRERDEAAKLSHQYRNEVDGLTDRLHLAAAIKERDEWRASKEKLDQLLTAALVGKQDFKRLYEEQLQIRTNRESHSEQDLTRALATIKVQEANIERWSRESEVLTMQRDVALLDRAAAIKERDEAVKIKIQQHEMGKRLTEALRKVRDAVGDPTLPVFL